MKEVKVVLDEEAFRALVRGAEAEVVGVAHPAHERVKVRAILSDIGMDRIYDAVGDAHVAITSGREHGKRP